MQSTLIVRDDDILGGIPVFAGTRVPVKTLFDCLKANYSLIGFLEDFPAVTPIQAKQVLEQFRSLKAPSEQPSASADKRRM